MKEDYQSAKMEVVTFTQVDVIAPSAVEDAPTYEWVPRVNEFYPPDSQNICLGNNQRTLNVPELDLL